MPGPVPVRSEQRRRRNKPADGVGVATAAAGERVPVPAADELWHPLAREWFESLAVSGQAVFYQASDWASAKVWAEFLSQQLSSGKPNSMMVSAWASAATELLTTEGARRRARVELERHAVDEDEEASVRSLAQYRERLA